MAKYTSGRQKNLKIGISSYSENLTSLEIIGKVGIGTTNATSNLSVVGDAKFTGVITARYFIGDGSELINLPSAGIATYASNAGIATYASNAGVATNLIGGDNGSIPYQYSSGITSFISIGAVGYVLQSNGASLPPSWEIAAPANAISGITIREDGLIVGVANSISQLNFVGPNITATVSGNISTITVADYVSNAGVASELTTTSSVNTIGIITASNFSGSGANLTSLNASNLSTGVVPSARITASGGDFTVGNNLYVNGNLSVGGTSVILNATTLQVNDKDIIVGYTTNVNNNDVSNDTTANHGGIAVASTVGSPIINIPLQIGINSNPSTYKQIMWIKEGTYSGMGTDAWVFNYGVSIGNTSSVKNGSRLTVGAGFTVYDTYLDVENILTRNINATGIITGSTFRPSSGYIQAPDGTNSFYIYNGTGDVAFQGKINTGQINSSSGYKALDFGTTTTPSVNITNNLNVGSGVSVVGIVTASSFSGNATSATYATTAGIATYASNAGIATGLTTTSNINTSGIITAFKFFGDGSSLTNLVAPSSGIGINLDGVPVGYAATIINFSSGISVTPIVLGITTVSVYYSPNSGIATYATSAGIATYADNAGIATYATYAGIATYATSAGVATTATTVDIMNTNGLSNVYYLTFVENRTDGQILRGDVDLIYRTDDNILTVPNVSATTFTGALTGNATSATYATSAGIATYATSAGISTDVIGGIASVTSLDVSGVSTLGIVKISSGIVTATSGIVTYYGDGSKLTKITPSAIGAIAGITINDEGSIVGTAGSVNLINFVGPNVTSTASGAGSTITIADYVSLSGVATYATSAGIATALQNSRTFEITGDIIASPISFDGTGNVSFAATIQPNSVGLGTDTFGDYVRSISGTSNQITVTSGTGEGSTPTLSIPNQFTVPQDIEVIRDLQVNRNLNVNGNITIGGTSASLLAQELKIYDPDIVLGVRTDAFGNDISTDNTANHGGVALASTEGNPLVQLFIAGIETSPATYKKIMWFKAGEFAGLGTDAWLVNYAVGIGSTQFPTGTRLAAGSVQFTENDLSVVKNINASGIITGTLANTLTLNTSGTGLSGSATYNNSGVATFTVTSNATSNNTPSTIVVRDASGNFSAGTITANLTGTASTASFATTAYNLTDAANITAGIIDSARLTGTYTININGNASSATYATNAGTTTSVIGGIGSITQLFVSGISTVGNFLITPIGTGATVGGIGITYYGDGSKLQGVVSGINVQDEGITVGTSVTTLNFTGVSVSISTVFAGISTVSVSSNYVDNAGLATYVKGGLAGNILYQSAPNITEFLANGSTGTILQSNGVGNAPSWVSAAPANAISGLTVRDEGSIVGSADSISTFNFVGENVTATASAGIATITILGSTTNIVGSALSISGISTFTNGPVLIGGGTFTGTASQSLQVTGISSNVYIGGGLGVGVTNNTTAGNIVVSGTVTANSDEKLKTNIKTIENALDKVLSLRGVEYDRIDNGDHQIGLIAQEVEKVIPQVVYPKSPSPDYETKSVSYQNIVGLLIEAIKEQEKRILELERKLGEN